MGGPNVPNRERLISRINELLDRRRLTNDGPFVRELEKRIAGLLGVKHCIATCNGTTALEIAIRALGVEGEFIIPSMTFIATAHALAWQGVTPVFCDVDATSYTLDPRRIEEMITPRTAGIIGVHLWGRPCDLDSIGEIAQRRNLKLLYDAAHAFGCSYDGRMIGNFGDAEVFSFHATKYFHTFEGGAVVTNDPDIARKSQLMRNFGFEGYDSVVSLGTNGKMTEPSAAMGLTLLESLDDLIEANRRNYERYRDHLEGIPGVELLVYDQTEKRNYQHVILSVDPLVTHVSRDQLLEVLWAENVLARRYFYPGCHRMEPYRSRFPDAGQYLPVTEKALERVIALPNGTQIGPVEVDVICQIIQKVIENGARVSESLEQDSS